MKTEKDLPYYRLWVKDFDTNENVRVLDLAELGLYLSCLNHSWINDGLPPDPLEIARALKIRPAQFNRLWKRVGKCFRLEGVRLVNNRQEEERVRAVTKSQQSSDAVAERERKKSVRSSDDHPRALRRAESDYEYVSGSSGSKTKTENQNPLRARYREFVEAWSKPDEEGRVFTCGDIDLGCQVWSSLVDSGAITEENVDKVFAGLERHRLSEKWRTGFVLSVPAFLGWSKSGTPAGPRWNDRPKPAAREE